ncbi:MAG: MarR family transcriptional regulator [Oscillospiraceae bacterium]|nr:MarR family transcriptional regulator [Oscillospiraceae bacterium]
MQSRFEHISYLVSAIDRCIGQLEREEMEKQGYKGAYAQYLAALSRYPHGLTPSELSVLCDRDKAAVSRCVGQMEKQGLLTRNAEQEQVYKAKLVLTPAGKQAAEFVCRRAQTAVEAVGDKLTQQQRQTMYEALEYIASGLEKLTREGIPQE